jgi:integrase
MYQAYQLVIFVLAYCGVRWSELAALRVEHIDLMRRRLNVRDAVTESNGGVLAGIGAHPSRTRRGQCRCRAS